MLDFFPIRWSTVWLAFWVGLGSPRVRTGLFDRHTLNDSNKTINFRVAWHTDIPNKWMTYKSIQKKERERKKNRQANAMRSRPFWLTRTHSDGLGWTDGRMDGRTELFLGVFCVRTSSWTQRGAEPSLGDQQCPSRPRQHPKKEIRKKWKKWLVTFLPHPPRLRVPPLAL